MQWIAQTKRMRTESLVQQLKRIESKIGEFEHLYVGTFEQIFGRLTEAQAD
jgi:hypothetical protein